MIPSIKLINALESAAAEIDLGNFDWLDMTFCTCGLVASCLLDLNYVQLDLELDKIKRFHYKTDYLLKPLTWTIASNLEPVCSQTKLPLKTIITTLNQSGLSAQDIQNIEYCLPESGYDPRSKTDQERYQQPKFVANWLRDKAEELRQELVTNQETQQLSI